MINNNLCPVQIEPNSPLKTYVVWYTNGVKKEVEAHNIDEAWNKAYDAPYEVLDVVCKKGD